MTLRQAHRKREIEQQARRDANAVLRVFRRALKKALKI